MLPVRLRPLPGVVFIATLLLVSPLARAHSPHDVMNVVAVTRGADGEQVVFARAQLTSKGLFVRSFDSGRSWSVTALPINERDLSRIAFSPAFGFDGSVFLSTTDQGILHSTDRGDHWSILNSGGLDLRVLDMVVSPDFATSQRMVAATAVGIQVSEDGGQNWTTHVEGLTQLAFSRLAVDGFDPDVLLGGKTVLHRSDDGGLTWTALHSFPAAIVSLELSPTFSFDGRAIACLKDGQGIWTTADGGTTWQPMVLGLTEATVNDVAIGRLGKVYAVTPVDGLFVGTLGGSWSQQGSGWELLSNLTENHYRTVDLSPDHATDENVWVGGFEGLFRSEDDGQRFRPMDIYHQRYVRTVTFPPDYAATGRLFIQPYGGGLLTAAPSSDGVAGGGSPAPGGALGPGTPGGPTGSGGRGATPQVGIDGAAGIDFAWESRSSTITALFGQGLDLSPAWPDDPTVFYSQAGIWRSEDGARSWQNLPKPGGVDVLRAVTLSPHFTSDRMLLAGAGLFGGVYRSYDAGDSWHQLTVGLPAEPSPGEFLFSPDYGVDDTIYMSDRADGFFVSTDGGDSWAESSAGLGDDEDLQCFVMSPEFSVDGTFFVGTGLGGVYRSTDGGASWSPANVGLPEDLPLSVESLAFSPDYAVDRTLFAAVLQAGVFRSRDGGDSWKPVGPGLPPDAPRVVAISPDFANDGRVIVSTHSWIWLSEDRGLSWQRLPGHARVDNANNVLSYQGTTLVEEQPVEPGYGGLSAEFLAWLLEDACEGERPTDAAPTEEAGAPAVLDSWPVVAWPAGALAIGVSLSENAGDLCELDFRGHEVRWYAAKGPDGGIARIVLDGQVAGFIDLYAPEDQPTELVFEFSWQQVGDHRIRVLNGGTSHPASSGTVIRSDGFDYSY